MATINFPDTTGQPTDGSFTYEFNGTVYAWDGEKWIVESSGGSGGGGGFSGDYNDLTNTPDIPDATSDLTNDSGFITDAGVTKIVAGTNVTIDPVDGTGEVTINAVGGSGGGGFSGDYNDLTNKPDIPDSTNDLTNDSGFITAADIPPIPDKTSDLTNDSGFITSADIPAIPANTSDLTNDSGFITDAGVTKIVAGNNITVSGDGTGEVTITGTGGGGGTNQNLSYADGGKDGAGTVQITDGTNATIPTVTSSKAGLMTGSQKQLLDGIIAGGGGFSGDYNDLSNKPTIPTNNNQLTNGAGYITASSVPAPSVNQPLHIDASQRVELQFNRGLTSNLNQLETKLGARLRYDASGAIETVAFPDAVESFEPIFVLVASDHTKATARGPYETTAFSGSFTLPDGVNGFSVISRIRTNLLCTTDGTVSDGGTVPTMWCNEIGYVLNFNNNISGTSLTSARIKNLGLPVKVDRGTGGFCVRQDAFIVTGSGNRTINWTCNVVVADAHGGSPPQGEMVWNGLSFLILPVGD